MRQHVVHGLDGGMAAGQDFSECAPAQLDPVPSGTELHLPLHHEDPDVPVPGRDFKASAEDRDIAAGSPDMEGVSRVGCDAEEGPPIQEDLPVHTPSDFETALRREPHHGPIFQADGDHFTPARRDLAHRRRSMRGVRPWSAGEIAPQEQSERRSSRPGGGPEVIRPLPPDGDPAFPFARESRPSAGTRQQLAQVRGVARLGFKRLSGVQPDPLESAEPERILRRLLPPRFDERFLGLRCQPLENPECHLFDIVPSDKPISSC
jgi:hypothetical protein